MLKTMVASKTAKLLAACVCPVVGASVVTVSVPQVRSAVHRATAPRAYAAPKTRARPQVAAAAAPCMEPAAFATGLIAPLALPSQSFVPADLANASPITGRTFNPPPDGGPIIGGGGSSGGPGGPGVAPPSPIPEPATWLQLLLGFGLIGTLARASYRNTRFNPDNDPEELAAQNGTSPSTLPPSA